MVFVALLSLVVCSGLSRLDLGHPQRTKGQVRNEFHNGLRKVGIGMVQPLPSKPKPEDVKRPTREAAFF